MDRFGRGRVPGFLEKSHGTGSPVEWGRRIEVKQEKAAKKRHATAQYNLGVCYYNGTCVEQSYSKARELWTKAAAQGDEGAIKGLNYLDKAGL